MNICEIMKSNHFSEEVAGHHDEDEAEEGDRQDADDQDSVSFFHLKGADPDVSNGVGFVLQSVNFAACVQMF